MLKKRCNVEECHVLSSPIFTSRGAQAVSLSVKVCVLFWRLFIFFITIDSSTYHFHFIWLIFLSLLPFLLLTFHTLLHPHHTHFPWLGSLTLLISSPHFPLFSHFLPMFYLIHYPFPPPVTKRFNIRALDTEHL